MHLIILMLINKNFNSFMLFEKPLFINFLQHDLHGNI